MNTETMEIYRGEEAVRAAEERGEPLVGLTEEQAKELEGCANRAERRAKARELGLFRKRSRG